jgi:hypothetical protein
MVGFARFWGRCAGFVRARMAGTKPAVISDDGYVTMGGPEEATYYVTECGAAWHPTPAAAPPPWRRNDGHARLCTDPALSVQF